MIRWKFCNAGNKISWEPKDCHRLYDQRTEWLHLQKTTKKILEKRTYDTSAAYNTHCPRFSRSFEANESCNPPPCLSSIAETPQFLHRTTRNIPKNLTSNALWLGNSSCFIVPLNSWNSTACTRRSVTFSKAMSQTGQNSGMISMAFSDCRTTSMGSPWTSRRWLFRSSWLYSVRPQRSHSQWLVLEDLNERRR